MPSSRDDLIARFPNLGSTDFVITSPEDKKYNCIAWAMDEKSRWWDPGGFYWPPNVIKDFTVESYIAAFATKGYSVCSNPDLETGFEKVVLYVNVFMRPSHAAKQLPDGRWASKLGQIEDIEHFDLNGVGGLKSEGYGAPHVFFKRRRSSVRPSSRSRRR